MFDDRGLVLLERNNAWEAGERGNVVVERGDVDVGEGNANLVEETLNECGLLGPCSLDEVVRGQFGASDRWWSPCCCSARNLVILSTLVSKAFLSAAALVCVTRSPCSTVNSSWSNTL